MLEVMFLAVLGLVWIGFASIQDLKKTEIANWLSFSLVIFALGFRFFWSLFEAKSFMFFYQGLIGLGIFFIIGNLLYYGRMFAGGDAKLMIALGAVLPFSSAFFINLKIFVWFFILFLFVGAFYGIIWSLFLMSKNFKNFKKEFAKKFKENRKFIFLIMFWGLVFMISGVIDILFFTLGIMLFILPIFYLYAKAVDEACMIREVKGKDLMEGDWLYEDVKIGGKIIKKNWEGLSKDEIKLLRNKIVKIRHGIPFIPVFLISFILLLIVWFSGMIFSLF